MRQRIPRQFEVVRWRRPPGHRLARPRVTEREGLRMQRRPSDQWRAAAIDRVAQNRMMDVSEMDPDLVGPARSELDLEQGVAAGDAEPPELGEGVAPTGDDRHPLPVLRIAPDRSLDACRGVRNLADDDRPVRARHDPMLQLAGQFAMRVVVARHHHQSRGVTVEPVDDTGPFRTADRRPAHAAAEQAVDERAGRMARPRMDESATLKIGQCGTWMKSITEPLTPRS